MLGKKEEQIFFTFDGEYDKPKANSATHSKQECSMCGDVGFPDQLQQCTRCRFRFQHTYCCNSKEGLGTGVWMCDWCQIGKEAAARNDRRGGSQPSAAPSAAMASCTVPCVSGESAGALEFLLKAALNDAGVDAAQAAGGEGLSSSVDERSLAPSGIESVVKVDDIRLGGEGSGDAILGGSNQERISSDGEEAAAIVTSSPAYPCNTPENNNGCDPKRNPKLLRCNSKTSQKRRHRSLLEQQCGSQVQLKRLSSLKGGKSGIACDPTKSFVRRYKSLSDISF